MVLSIMATGASEPGAPLPFRLDGAAMENRIHIGTSGRTAVALGAKATACASFSVVKSAQPEAFCQLSPSILRICS